MTAETHFLQTHPYSSLRAPQNLRQAWFWPMIFRTDVSFIQKARKSVQLINEQGKFKNSRRHSIWKFQCYKFAYIIWYIIKPWYLWREDKYKLFGSQLLIGGKKDKWTKYNIISITLWSSSFVQGPLINSGLRTFCHRCWHWKSERFWNNFRRVI